MIDMNGRKALSNIDLTKQLIKINKIKSGYFELSVNFMINAGGVHVAGSNVLPGITLGVNGIGLVESTQDNKNAVNAADVR